MEDNEASISTVSRRRLAFRPNSLRKKLASPLVSEKSAPDGINQLEKTISLEQALGGKCHPQQPFPPSDVDKTKRIIWTFPEQMAFYEALKLHGKEFDAVAKFMARKKMSKDREQIRNYYLNTYKLWKSKAQIKDLEWTDVPRDARELLILLNGFEWKKRLGGCSLEQEKFKSMVFDGTVSFRPKRRKFTLCIKTPFCPALLKFFPFERKHSQLPTHIVIRLKPLRNMDLSYVAGNEQNPFLQLNMSINEKITSVFQFLEKKWTMNCSERVFKWCFPNAEVSFKLFVDNGTKVHNILVGVDEDNSPVLSLKRLKKEVDSRIVGSTEEQTTSVIITNRQQKDVLLSPSSVKEVFEINQEKIREGLSEENIGGASILQLYYLLGMKNELTLNYQVIKSNPRFKAWELFVGLVARDYDDLMAKSLTANTEAHTQTLMSTRKTNRLEPQVAASMGQLSTRSLLEQQKQTLPVSQQPFQQAKNIVDEENLQFIEQLKAQRTRQVQRPRRQIKLVPTHTKSAAIYPNVGQLHLPHNRNLFARPMCHFVGNGSSTSSHSTQIERRATDFSRLGSISNEIRIAEIGRTEQHLITSELTLDSTTTMSQFPSIVLDNSPNKTLPEDVRNAYELMLKENSVDYCRQFEQLTRMHQDNSSLPSNIHSADSSHFCN